MSTLETRSVEHHTGPEAIGPHHLEHVTREAIAKASDTATITAAMVAKTLAKAMAEKPPLAALADINAQDAIEW